MRAWTSWTVAVVAVLCLPVVAPAVIKNLIPLRDVLASEQFIFVAHVESIDPEKPAAILRFAEALKGKPSFGRMPINLTGDAEAKRENHTAQIVKRLSKDLPVIVFCHRQGPRFLAFVYTNGTWFQMEGRGNDPAETRWSFLHGEPYLRRTFKGTTEELKQVVIDGLAGTKPPPAPEEKEPPGFGPEVKPAEKPRQPAAGLPVAVIPTFVLVGPLAVLAAVFPALFGGLALLMRRWLVALSVTSLVSTSYSLYVFFGNRAKGTWWGTPAALWCGMSVLGAVGAIWAATRYRRAFREGSMDLMTPRRGDRVVLIVLSIAGIGALGYALIRGLPVLQSPWAELLVCCVPVWVATIASISIRSRDPQTPGISLETVFLWGLVFACANLGALEIGRAETGANPQVVSGTGRVAHVAWTFEPDENGTIVSTPLIAGGRVYVAAALGGGFSRFGAVFAIDAATGKEIWRFDDDKGMKNVFSSPCLHDGKLYVGEGFHEDKDCRIFCLDAATGAKLWEFQTTSHTESGIAVAGGKILFGAGDDGVYCLDAVTGKEIWHYERIHVDATPAIANGRVFVGSGVGDQFNETLLVSLDLATGKEVWRMPVDQAAFAPPTVAMGRVLFGIGNGNMIASASNPIGAVLCLDAATGKRIWRFDAQDAVLGQPLVHRDGVYITARDGNCYAVDLNEGKARWKQHLGSPIVSGAAASADGQCLYLTTTAGRAACLSMDTGEPIWFVELTQMARVSEVQLLASPVVQARRLVIAAGLSNGLSKAARVYVFEDEVTAP